MDSLVFIDCEFCPDSEQWLSLGAVLRDRLFYAETSDTYVLARASAEFGENPIGNQVLGQLGRSLFPPGAVTSPAEMARAFVHWLRQHAGDNRVDICYDYSLDIALLERALKAASIPWPANWHPCSLAILNEDPVADTARERVWSCFAAARGLRRHHALADAAALQAAYLAQSAAS